jgi:hypothetical protein
MRPLAVCLSGLTRLKIDKGKSLAAPPVEISKSQPVSFVEVEPFVPKTKTSQTVANYPQLTHRSRFRIIEIA